MNYEKEYTEYWSRSDRWESHSFKDPQALANQIQTVCGRGSIVDVGCGMGLLVRTLAGQGIDASGVDIAPRPVEAANQLAPGRFRLGSILSLPFPDESFDTVVTTDCLEHIAEADVPAALKELRRVARRFVFVQLATTRDRDGRWHLAIHDRAWWEGQFFAVGFRRHPLQQLAVPYESLESENWQITLVFEKIPARALAQYPLQTLKAERDLHMDMLRESGRRSDAHIARYMLARQYLPSEGVVVDAACGLGYGSALLAQSSPACQVIGIDNSEFAATYAETNFCPNLPLLSFRQGDVCDLSSFADSSVDLVASFETVEHLREPEIFLKEVQRVLKPDGVFICSVPNLWVDETGTDPNPWHFHVFDFPKLARLCAGFFDLGEVYRQTAGGGMKLNKAPRELRRVNLPVTSGHDQAEWWLVAARSRKKLLGEIKSVAASDVVVSLAFAGQNPLFTSWLSELPCQIEHVTEAGLDYVFPENTALVVAVDTYNEPRVTLLRKAVEQQIPTLILADGILEYRNTWEHPQIVPGSIFQPVLSHKIACLGHSQARIIETWGNAGKCEVVGSPKFDTYAGLKRRQRQPDEPFRILVMTALTPYFTEAQHDLVRQSLLDLKRFFDGTQVIDNVRVEPIWRLTKGLESEIGVKCFTGDLTGRELAEFLQNVDAVITTPSTSMLEAMLLGLPVAVLDYCNCPHYVQAAWRITAIGHITSTVAELLDPPAPKMLFQESMLHDSLECATPSRPRLLALASGMIAEGKSQRNSGRPLQLSPRLVAPDPLARVLENKFQPALLYPDCVEFQAGNTSALQVEIAHLRRYAAKLEKQSPGGQLEPADIPTKSDGSPAPVAVYECMQHTKTARLVRGAAEQLSVWELVFEGAYSKSLFLHPPAEIAFDVPTGAAGWLTTAVMLHPDVWEKPKAGGCEFHIRVDGRLGFVVARDPVNVKSDRCWHEIKLPISETPLGRHKITFETRAIGASTDFRWALWRAPRFTWPVQPSSPREKPSMPLLTPA